MATFEIPTLEEHFLALLDDYRARFPEDSFAQESDNWKRVRVLAGATFSLYYQQQIGFDDLFPDTASDEKGALDRHGTIWGVTRLGASPANGENALRVFGTPSTSVTSGLTLTAANGAQFQVDENDTIGSSGFIDVDLVGVTTGEITNLTAGEKLVFDSPPAGIDATAELQADLDNGEDKEAPDRYRVRILDRIRQPGMGGNNLDFKTWVIESNSMIRTAYVWPLRDGLGTVDYAALFGGSGSARLLDAGERTALYNYVEARRPVALLQHRALEVTTLGQAVELAVKGKPGVTWDWDDSTPPTVSTWTAATRTLNFGSGNRPPDMLEGHRICIRTVARNGTGKPIKIESLSGADSIVLAETPSVAPTAGDFVHSAGDLTDDIRDAVLNFIKGLGPAIGNYGVGDWDDTIAPDRLEALAFQTSDDVRDVDTIEPSTAVVPTDPSPPSNTTIELLIATEVVVRRLF